MNQISIVFTKYHMHTRKQAQNQHNGMIHTKKVKPRIEEIEQRNFTYQTNCKHKHKPKRIDGIASKLKPKKHTSW